MNDFDFPRLIAYYTKVLAGCLKSGGRDWRWALYQERLDRVTQLSTSLSLMQADRDYLAAREAVAEAFR